MRKNKFNQKMKIISIPRGGAELENEEDGLLIKEKT